MKKNVCSSGTATMHTNQANSNVWQLMVKLNTWRGSSST
jgi:hypothetical protein